MRPVDGAAQPAPVDITIRINEKLAGLTPHAPDYCVFRVHTQLRKVNEKAYDPQLLAIGPYNRGRNDLMHMEGHKLRYLHLFLQRRNENSVEPYIRTLRLWEESARQFYAEPISLSSDEFLEMMLLDGLFIIELFRKFARKVPFDIFDPIEFNPEMFDSVQRDLLLFENQIPFFLLGKLFTQTDDGQEDLVHLAMCFFQLSSLPFGRRYVESPESSSFGRRYVVSPESSSFGHLESPKNISHLLDFFHDLIAVTSPFEMSGTRYDSIASATELQEAGVKFKKLESRGSILNIEFNNGVLEIPPLELEGRSESIIRNLIAYEHYSNHKSNHPFTDYVSFMDNLINYPKDVELLRRRGIIKNLLGDDEAVSTMFKKIGRGVSMDNIFYAGIFIDVNQYCQNRQWRRLLNVCMNKYFRSAWAFISSLAAAFLLLLTITQTIFAVISYFAPRK